MSPLRYFPLFAQLRGRSCLVVGGGPIAQRKVSHLLTCHARVTVVSPTLTKPLQRQAAAGKIRHRARRFRPADLQGAWLVFAATDDQAINQAVHRAAGQQRIFANVVDQKALCSFIAPAIARRGPLTIAVSTGGFSPALAKRIRDEASRQLAQTYQPLVRLLGGLRAIAQRRLPTYRDRQRYFERLLADDRLHALVRQGCHRQARQAALRLLTPRRGARR